MESFVTAPRLSVDEGERRRCWTIRGIDSLRAFSNLADSSWHTNDEHHEKVIRTARNGKSRIELLHGEWPLTK